MHYSTMFASFFAPWKLRLIYWKLYIGKQEKQKKVAVMSVVASFSSSSIAKPSNASSPFFVAELPLPPGMNASYKIANTRAGSHTIIHSAEAHDFNRDAALLLSQAYACNQEIIDAIKKSKKKTPLLLTIFFYFPTLWKRDIDGPIKIVQDAVFRHLQINDNLVTCLIVEKHADKLNPRVEVSLSCILTSKA